MVRQGLKHDLSAMSELNSAAYETAAALAEYDKPGELMQIEKVLFAEFFNHNDPLLDIGCGAGRTTYRLVEDGVKVVGRDLFGTLLEDGLRVVGADLSGTLLEAARVKCPGVEFHHADVRHLPFEDESFSQALFSHNGMDQVHPIGDYLIALKEVRRVLIPNGIFIY